MIRSALLFAQFGILSLTSTDLFLLRRSSGPGKDTSRGFFFDPSLYLGLSGKRDLSSIAPTA